MRGLNVHKNIPVSINKLMLIIRVGFISSHLIADKLFLVNPWAITDPPKMSLLLEAKSMPELIIKPRFILVTHTDDLGWSITSNQQEKMFFQKFNRIVRKPNVTPMQFPYCARPRDYHSLGLTRIQFHPYILFHPMGMAVVPSPGARVAVAESLIRDLGRVSEWCDLWGMNWMRVRPRLWLSRGLPQCIHSHHHYYWRNWAEGIRWPWYFGSDIWFKDDLWEAALLGFQSSFAKTWYLEEVLASVPW